MKKVNLVLAAGLALAGFAFAADEASRTADKVDRSVDRAANNLDRAADNTRDAANRAADKANRAGDKVIDKIGEVDVKTERTANQSDPQLPPGVQKSAKDDSEDIRQSLATVAEATLKKDGPTEVIKVLVDADRNRLNSAKGNYNEVAMGLANQIRNDFKAKYNQEFDVPHKVAFGTAFPNFLIVQGEINNPTLLSDWPVPNNRAKGDTQAPDRDTANRPGNKPGDRNLEKGRNVAVVVFPASHGMPEVKASMIHELPDHWVFDIPDSVTTEKFNKNLQDHLHAFASMKDQWPADVNDAYRGFTHCVLMALYDIPMQPDRAPDIAK